MVIAKYIYIGKFSTKAISVYFHKNFMQQQLLFYFGWVRTLKLGELKSLFNFYNKLMETPLYEFMAGFPVHCSFHQPCIAYVNYNGAMIGSLQKVTLQLFYCFSQSILSQLNVVICAHVLTLHWSTSSFAWHSFKALAYQ